MPVLAVSSVKAATLAYSNDFLADDGEFTETTDAHWLETGGVYRNTISLAEPSAATVQVTRPANENFVMQARFTINATTTGSSYSVGFAALGTTAATTGAVAGTDFYLADVGNTGTIRILRFNGTGNTSLVADTSATGSLLGNLVTTEIYDMTLTGTYTGSALVLAFTVFDGTNTRTVTTSSQATPLTGSNFGFRDRNNTTGIMVADIDSFAMAVPEPSSALLIGAGMTATLLRRRR